MNHKLIIENLIKYGLTENEAKLYCSVLALEEATVDKIAIHADLNRTSSYPILERLKYLGLISQGKKKKRTVFKAVQPEKLFQLLDEKRELVSQIMPNLKSLFDISRGKPDVSFFEGKEGLKTVLNNILQDAKEVCILGNGENFIDIIPGWTEVYVQKRAKKNIKVKLILQATPYALKSIEKIKNEDPTINKLLQIRVLPEFYKINYGGFDIYNDKVNLYSFEKHNHVVVIESPVISQLMQTTFDILWDVAGKYEYLIKN